MNCEWVKDNAFLYAYGELSDDLRYEFEQHVNRCGDCANEVAALRGLREVMNANPVIGPSPSLLASARMRLQEQLEITEQERGWKRWFYDPFPMLGALKFSPALAAVLLICGFAGGVGTTWKLSHAGNPGIQRPAQSPMNEASIAGFREIQQDPSTNKVSIKYDTLAPQTYEGNIDDPKVQQLLVYAARNNNNSGVRLSSIDVLAKQPEDNKIREALIASLRFDPNPGVRLKTLEALGPFVKDDQLVRNAAIESLLHDANPGVRMLALQLLQPVKADSTVRMTLQYLAEKDKDSAIRRQSRAMLATVPQIY